jgi:Rrf2 family protein
MRLSAKTEYAALAALALARCWDREEPLSIRAISTAEHVPERFLVHILLQLKAAGLVTSIRGAAGGYHLAKPPRDITLEDIHRAIEGRPDSIAPITGGLARRSRAAAVLDDAWGDAALAETTALRSITLADLADRCHAAVGAMYYI